jgi:putative integral membrane protein (TIGR02587 family)
MARTGGWHQEGEDLVRGVTGGLLIGTPLLYTMETWAIGSTMPPLGAITLLGVAYLLNLACVVFAGFRQGVRGIFHLFSDALDATALALVTSALMLALLAQIGLGAPIGVMLGQIVVNAIPVSLGIAVANQLIAHEDSRAESESDSKQGSGSESEGEKLLAGAGPGVRSTLLDLGATAAGALFFCFNIAPTEEVQLLAAEMPLLHLAVAIVVSLLVTYAIVFVADFAGYEQRRSTAGLIQHPVTETAVAYLLSLLIAAGALWLFGAIRPDTDPLLIYAQVIVLGLPAAIGGAAGRLAI